MIRYFDTDIAAKYGIGQAVLIQGIADLIRYNKERNLYFHDGRYWIRNSEKELSRLFPEIKKVRTVIDSLISADILMKGYFNESAYDRTRWLTFTDYGTIILREHNINN